MRAKFRSVVHRFFVLAALSLVGGIRPGLAAADLSSVKAFSIPPQAVPSALLKFSSQSGVQVMSSGELLEGRQSPGVYGMLTAHTALDRLLKGTALRYDIIDPNTVAIRGAGTGRGSGAAAAAASPGSSGAGKEGGKKAGRSFSDSFRVAQVAGDTSAGSFSVASRSASRGNSDVLREVIVTANKRTEPLSKTGISVSVVSGQLLQDRAAQSLQDYLAFIPGVSLQSGGTPGFGEVEIRGISPQSVGATVATYVDGVPFGPSSALTESALFTLDMNPTDLDHIEVLKGPQGTLYGASSMGGLIKYVTRAPDLNAPEYEATEDVNQAYNGSPGGKVSGAVSLPLIPGELAIRLNGYYMHDGGYITDVGVGGKDTNRENNNGFHGSLLYQPFDALSIRLNAISQNTAVHGQDVVDIDQATGKPAYGGWSQLRYVTEPFTNSIRLYSAEINYRLNKMTLVSATSYSSLDPYSVGDITSIYQAIGLPQASPTTPIGGVAEYPSHKVTEELRLDADRMGPVEWMAGLFFQHEQVSDWVNVYQVALPSYNSLRTSFRDGTLTEYAGFANLTYYIAPSFDITAGYRNSHISQTSYRGAAGVLENPVDPTHYITSYQAFEESSNTYSAGLRWRITDAVMWYARAASGYRPGGGRTIPFGAPPGYADFYKSDSLWDYESGLKLRSLGGRLTFDGDVFWMNWKNIQTLVPLPGSIIVNDGNGGTALSRGAEAEVKWIPVDGLIVGANGAFTQAKFTQTVPGVAENGEALFYVPKFTATAYGDYSRLVGRGWTSYIGADYQYTGLRLDENLTPLPAYSVWNVHLGIRDAHYRVNIYVNNLTNKMAFLGYGNGGYGAPTYDFAVNQPRVVGIMLSETF